MIDLTAIFFVVRSGNPSLILCLICLPKTDIVPVPVLSVFFLYLQVKYLEVNFDIVSSKSKLFINLNLIIFLFRF
jgi:hypothetical protein